MKEHMQQLMTQKQAAQLAKEAVEQQAFDIEGAEEQREAAELAGQEAQQQAM